MPVLLKLGQEESDIRGSWKGKAGANSHRILIQVQRKPLEGVLNSKQKSYHLCTKKATMVVMQVTERSWSRTEIERCTRRVAVVQLREVVEIGIDRFRR